MVKPDIAVTILLRCMCVHACVYACVPPSIRPSHNSYIYAWILQLFDIVEVLEEEKSAI